MPQVTFPGFQQGRQRPRVRLRTRAGRNELVDEQERRRKEAEAMAEIQARIQSGGDRLNRIGQFQEEAGPLMQERDRLGERIDNPTFGDKAGQFLQAFADGLGGRDQSDFARRGNAAFFEPQLEGIEGRIGASARRFGLTPEEMGLDFGELAEFKTRNALEADQRAFGRFDDFDIDENLGGDMQGAAGLIGEGEQRDLEADEDAFDLATRREDRLGAPKASGPGKPSGSELRALYEFYMKPRGGEYPGEGEALDSTKGDAILERINNRAFPPAPEAAASAPLDFAIPPANPVVGGGSMPSSMTVIDELQKAREQMRQEGPEQVDPSTLEPIGSGPASITFEDFDINASPPSVTPHVSGININPRQSDPQRELDIQSAMKDGGFTREEAEYMMEAFDRRTRERQIIIPR